MSLVRSMISPKRILADVAVDSMSTGLLLNRFVNASVYDEVSFLPRLLLWMMVARGNMASRREGPICDSKASLR